MNLGGTIRLNRTGLILAIVIGVIILFIHFSRYRSAYEESEENLVNLKSMLVGAIEAAKLGGKKVIAGTKGELKIKSKGKTQEGVNDPVTDADFASHCEMYGGLMRAFPGVHMRSEEEAGTECPPPPALALEAAGALEGLAPAHVHPDDVTVWIDPLDATKEYTDSLHQYVTTMVCVAVKGVPIIGVIHSPFTQRTSWAWLAHGSSHDLQAATPSGDHKLSPHVVVSMSHKGAVKTLASSALGPGATVGEAAGAGFKVLEVAHSRADLYLHNTNIKKWDICAGNAIINAMGGRMTTLKNETLDYSFDSQDINKDGLLAALQNHDYYVGKIIAASAKVV